MINHALLVLRAVVYAAQDRTAQLVWLGTSTTMDPAILVAQVVQPVHLILNALFAKTDTSSVELLVSNVPLDVQLVRLQEMSVSLALKDNF